MKKLLLASFCAAGLALSSYAQTPAPVVPQAPPMVPTAPVVAPVPAPPVPVATVAPVIVATPATTDELTNRLHKRIRDRVKRHKGFTFNIGDDDEETGKAHHESFDNGEIPKSVVPIVAISVLAVFGFPVAIVAVIMFSSWAKARSLHRTVQALVEKGQPIPPELLVSRAGAPLRPWYDLRRGIILLAVGVGIIFFFGTVAGFDAGVWALGLIPGIIGGGYILTWRLANKRESLLKQ